MGFQTLGGSPLQQGAIPIQEGIVVPLGLSPDGHWFAYTYQSQLNGSEPTTLSKYLLSSAGETVEQLLDVSLIRDVIEGELKSIAGFGDWINNEIIRVTLHIDDGDPYGHGFYIQKILSPFTGAWIEEPLESLTDRTAELMIGFSPDMRRVLYESVSGSRYNGLILRDLETNTILWADEDFDYGRGLTMMDWSDDGDWVAVTSLDVPPEERIVLAVSREGESKLVADTTFPVEGFRARRLAWSPDGKYLALVNENAMFTQGPPEIYIYDNRLDQYVLKCPLSSYDEAFPPQITWSPDSKAIALSLGFPEYPIQIFDIMTGELVDISKTGSVVGWSAIFPFGRP